MTGKATALLRCALIALALLAPSAGMAQTCSWTVSAVAFGSVDSLSGSNVDTTASVNITCSGFVLLLGNVVRACPNLGVGSGGLTEANRQMLSGSNALSYQLYSDAGHTTIWGSNFVAPDPPSPPTLTVTLSGLITGSGSLSPTLFARVFGGQSTAPSGAYLSSYSGTQAQLRYQQCSSLLGCPPCSTSLPESANTSFTVSATVPSNCLVSATTLNFGSEGVLNANVDASNAISITCTTGTPWIASLNAGSGAGGTINLRRMTGPGGATVGYTIYRNAARTEIWGDGTSGTLTVAGTGTGSAQAQTGYGRVPPQTTPAPATYTDTIVVTVTY